jgi:hypothetical protein
MKKIFEKSADGKWQLANGQKSVVWDGSCKSFKSWDEGGPPPRIAEIEDIAHHRRDRENLTDDSH